LVHRDVPLLQLVVAVRLWVWPSTPGKMVVDDVHQSPNNRNSSSRSPMDSSCASSKEDTVVALLLEEPGIPPSGIGHHSLRKPHRSKVEDSESSREASRQPRASPVAKQGRPRGTYRPRTLRSCSCLHQTIHDRCHLHLIHLHCRLCVLPCARGSECPHENESMLCLRQRHGARRFAASMRPCKSRGLCSVIDIRDLRPELRTHSLYFRDPPPALPQ